MIRGCFFSRFSWGSFLAVCALVVTHIAGDTDCAVVTSLGDRRNDTTRLRVVQYNAEWLFMDYCSASHCPGSGCTWANQTEAATHLTRVAQVIRDVNPDIVNLCEVEGCDELALLADQLDGSYASYMVRGTDASTGQNVGMLTRIDPTVNIYRTEQRYEYPIANSSCGYTGVPSTSGVSKHYITEFQFAQYRVAFVSAHLIAIPTDPSRCAQREAQASVLQTVLYDYINRDYEVVLLGDFNDYDGDVADVNGHQPTSTVLDILKGIKGEKSGKYALFSVAEEIVQSQRYSDWWDSDGNCQTASLADYSMIDHILVTDALRKNIANAFVYHGYDEYCGKYDSDHYPVVVDLVM